MARPAWQIEGAVQGTNGVFWTKKLEEKFSYEIVARGRGYFHSGAVTLQSGSPESVHAAVRGTARYFVTLELVEEDRTLLANCTCPYAEKVEACKHMWASLLASEKAGYLSKIAGMKACDLEVMSGIFDEPQEGEEDEEDGEDDYDWNPPVQHSRSWTTASHSKRSYPSPRTARKPAAARRQGWKRRLSQLRGVTRPVTAAAPVRPAVVYVIDVIASMNSGALVVRALPRPLERDGEWGKPPFHETHIRDAETLPAEDQRILHLLNGAQIGNYFPGFATKFSLPSDVRHMILPLMCATGRCFLKHTESTDDLLPISWDEGPPWTLRVRVARDEPASAYRMGAALGRDGEERPARDAVLLVEGLAFFTDRAARVEDGGGLQWARLVQVEDLIVPFESRKAFMSELLRFPELPVIEWPEELHIERRTPAGPPLLKIRKGAPQWRGETGNLRAEILFDYGGVPVSETAPAATLHDPVSDRYFIRDRNAEAGIAARLDALGFQRAGAWRPHRWELATDRLPKIVRALAAEGWRVEADGALYRRAGNFNIEVRSGIDWFDLEGNVEFEDQRAGIPEILQAVARGDTMVRLDDGSYGLLPEEWLRRYRLMAGFAESSAGRARFRRHQAGLLDALLASEPHVTFDAAFQRVQRQMAEFSGVHPADAPPHFTGELRQYQREGLGWLRFLRDFSFGGCLADDMGLGKTVQVLALLDSDVRRGPALVVAPRSLIFNWKQEAARFSPRLRVLDHTGAGRRERWKQIHKHDIILTTYGTLRRDAARLKDIRFDTVVLDEAQAIKNAATESAKAARLLKADHRLALTGTPVENRLSDLWSLFEFLNPGMLGSAPVFRAATASKNSGADAESQAALEVLSKALRPFLLRRTKEQVARELPAKIEQTIYCELDHEERRVYDELRGHYRASLLGRVDSVGIQKARMHILEALLRLRQAACHVGLIDRTRADRPSAKVDTLVEQVVEVIAGGTRRWSFRSSPACWPSCAGSSMPRKLSTNTSTAKRATAKPACDAFSRRIREITGFPLLEGILQDCRYGVRGMRRSPGFTGVAVAILALGIGINTIVFTVTDAVLFKGFPLVKENDRVLYLSSGRGCCASYPDFEDWRAQAESFEGMAPIHGIQMSFSDSTGFPESFQVSEVGAGTFQLAGQEPFMGRDFLPADEAPGARRVAILRYSFWERRYGKDPSIIGREVRINGEAATIIGVMPNGFSFPQNSDLWVPLIPTDEARQNDGDRGLWFVFARLRPGATVESARAEMETIGRRLGDAYPVTNQGQNLIPQVQRFHEFFIGDNATRIYQAMLAAVVFVLLIACANLANLLLARGMGRSRETWMRIALGAGRWRIVRQLLVESLSLSALGGFFGWWIAKLGVGLFALRANGPSLSDSIGGDWFNNTVDFTMDYRILVYLAAVSMATGVLFGLLPAFRVSKVNINSSLKEAGRGSTDGPRARRLSTLLVASEMALALVLLTGAGIMVRSFFNIYNASLGFQPENIATALFALPSTKYDTPEAQISFYNRLTSRLEAVPGIETVAIASHPPTGGSPAVPYELADAELVSSPRSERPQPVVARSVVGPGYFNALGVDLLSGREFEETDRAQQEPVVIVNQHFANTVWPKENAVGKRFRFLASNEEAWRTVAGVVPNLAFKDRTRQETLPMVYVPYLQEPRTEMWMVARTRVPPRSLTNVIRREVQRIDSDLPPKLGPFSLSDYLADSYRYRATTGGMFLAFAAIALLLASVGVYAVIAHSVGQRTQEIGIRMALGGTERDIRIMVLRHGVAPMGVGLAIGLAGSVAVSQFLRFQLVGVSPIDPLTFTAASGVLILGATLGCFIPARRASRIDPMTALRQG